MWWGLVRQQSVMATAVCRKPWLSSRSVHQQTAGCFPHPTTRAEPPGVIPEPLLQPPGRRHHSSSSSSGTTHPPVPLSSSVSSSQMLVDIITSGGGCLDDMEASLDRLGLEVTPTLVSQIIHSCRTAASPPTGSSSSSRRLLRFFSWCRNKSHEEFGDEVFNRAIRAFSEMKDLTSTRIIISDLQKEGRKMDPETFIGVAETLVGSGRAGEAVRLFRCTEANDNGGGWSSVVAIVHALCDKGHALDARRIFWHHKDRLAAAGEPSTVYRSLLHGWCVRGNAKEARRLIDEMKLQGIRPGLATYHDFLRCVCKRNLKFNPSALVPEATLVMDEMRCSGVPPTAVSFNILLSSLGRSRRVKEACRVLLSMMTHGEEPDWVSYYLVVRVLYLTGRFVRGHRVVDQMIKEGVVPVPRFYHGLISTLCGIEKVDHALKVFERMLRCCGQSNGPTFDLLITKLCRSGRIDIGKSIWDEAVAKGIILQCSSNLLDPLKTEVFKPIKEKSDTSGGDNTVVEKRMKVAVNRKRKVKRKKGHAT